MTYTDYNELLNQFLSRWPLEKVENLKLQDYVGIGNKDTFCQWIETKTRVLGSIKGLSSIKFGIYERKVAEKKPQNFDNDKTHSWLRSYNAKTKIEAFGLIKSDIIKIIEFSDKGQFNRIDDIILPDLFKWKIAFLYSNERLIPIFKRDVLLKIGKYFSDKLLKNPKISEVHELMISNKPADRDVYSHMLELYEQFGRVQKNDDSSKNRTHRSQKHRTKRTKATNRNTRPHIRQVYQSYLVEQKHNKIQEKLKNQLVAKYGENNVIIEENFVDIKVIQPSQILFYEVKSSSYAIDCIKQALGQILYYTYNDEDDRKKKIIVVGQYPATEQEKGYIEYLKNNLELEFNYIDINIG